MKKFELMALPYAPEALEPVISKRQLVSIMGNIFRRMWIISTN